MEKQDTFDRLDQLMESYVPEFSYDREGQDPGSVLTALCGQLMEDSEKRYSKVLHKHKIQFLNLFDSLKKEPVAAAKGYVQFKPITGYAGDIMVPAKTKVMGNSKDGDIVFETTHDMAVTNGVPQVVIMTDRKQDRIVKTSFDMKKKDTSFRAFDISGENQSVHKMYLYFKDIFLHLAQLDFKLYIEMSNAEEQQESMAFLAGDKVSWRMLEASGEEVSFDVIDHGDSFIHFIKKDYVPQKTVYDQKEGYFLVLELKEELPKLYINKLKIDFKREGILPDEMQIKGIIQPLGVVTPFGKPLELYSELIIESKEVFTKKGATITLEFDLDYVIHQELLEFPELDQDFKLIMRRPKKMAEIPVKEVKADYVIWEYLSKSGWKRLWREEHIALMFNGTQKGYQKLSFQCPEDMLIDGEENTYGKIRVRLLQAENIYKVPAVYMCPQIIDLKLSYSYEEMQPHPEYAFVRNGYEEREITADLIQGGGMAFFYNQEHERRAMYLGFQSPIWGSPISIYFDLENYSDVSVDFSVEYLSDQGFIPLKVVDYTGGFLGSGNMQLLIPKDMKKKNLYGYEGYFIRFVNYNKELKEYALPYVKGLYMNMAKVINMSAVTEEFYLEDTEHDQQIKLSKEKLIRADVWANEKTENGYEWCLWNPKELLKEGRKFYLDMDQGILHISRYALMDGDFYSDGPHIKVRHYNYTGSAANLEEKKITVMYNSVRYVSGVENPFPMYGGYDGYSEKSAENMVSGMLYTRNRAVTEKDFFYVISQTSFGVKKVKCVSDMDLFGKPKKGVLTVAVLIQEFEKGVQIFSEMKESMRKRLLNSTGLIPGGKELILTPPHFVKLNIRLWLERETMEQAYEIQSKAVSLIREFIDPLNGGIEKHGWEIGTFPGISQIAAYIKTSLPKCNIAKIVMTANIDGEEVPVKEDFYETRWNPFIMAVNGEHIVYIDIV